MHGGKVGCWDDKLALGNIVNIKSINWHITVGAGAVVHGNCVSIGRGKGDGVAPSALVVNIAVSANHCCICLLRGEVGELVWVVGNVDEVIGVAVEAKLPSFSAVVIPA